MVACGGGVSKNLNEGNETGSECKKKEQRERVYSPHPLPLLAHPLPASPQFFADPRRAPSLARFFARLFDLRLEKERKRPLRRLNEWLQRLKMKEMETLLTY